MITRIIDRNFANMRLDRFLRKAFPDESLSVFFAVIRKKKIRVNGVIGKANQMLAEGDTVCIYENFKSVEADDRTPSMNPRYRPPKQHNRRPLHPTPVSRRTSPPGARRSPLPKSRRAGARRTWISSSRQKTTSS